MKKKKILIDLSILKNEYCGLGQIALNYGKYFEQYCLKSEQNFDIFLLVPKHMVGRFGNNVKYIPIYWWSRYLLCLFPKFDVWHSIHQLSYYRPVDKRTKHLVTIHDLNFIYEKTALKQRFRLKKLQAEVDRADQIICISKFTKQDVEKFIKLRNKNIQIIHNGVEQTTGNTTSKPNFIKGDKPFFFSIGEIKKKKNFHVLLPLMKLYQDKHLFIAGRLGTQYAEYLQSIIESEKIDNVHLVGLVTNEERVWLYSHCEAFLFPSLFEGFGLPVIEAMSFGKPVFSSKETSLKEIGGDCSFFWNNFEPEHMKEFIDTLLNNFYKSSDLAKKNINHSKLFNYKTHMEKYLKEYENLLNK